MGRSVDQGGKSPWRPHACRSPRGAATVQGLQAPWRPAHRFHTHKHPHSFPGYVHAGRQRPCGSGNICTHAPLTRTLARRAPTQTFEVDEEVANESVTIRNMIEDTGTDESIPLPNVHGKILAKVRRRQRNRAALRTCGCGLPRLPHDALAPRMVHSRQSAASLFPMVSPRVVSSCVAIAVQGADLACTQSLLNLPA